MNWTQSLTHQHYYRSKSRADRIIRKINNIELFTITTKPADQKDDGVFSKQAENTPG